MLICSWILCGAQATTLTVENKVAGTLSQRILYDDMLTVENLSVSGEINADDMTYIDELNSSHKLTGTIDLSNANIVAGGRYLQGNKYLSTVKDKLNVGIFTTTNKVKKLILPQSITSWDEGSYQEANGSAGWATNYPNLNADSLIIDCPNLISVSNGIGTPSFLYAGEGLLHLSIASKYLGSLPGASDDFYLKAPDYMCIYLPKSLTSLSGNARMGTPKVTIYSKILRPDELSTGTKNWADVVLTNGEVYAPNDTKEYYEASIFKNLVIHSAISISSISLAKTDVKLLVGESIKNEATVYPSNADNKKIVWQTSNEEVVTVDENGIITAKSGGFARIDAVSVENPNIKASCDVNVIQPTTGVTLNTNSLELVEDESFRLIASVQPTDATNKGIKWTSSDLSVAMVSADGTVYAVKQGQATIMVTTEDGGFVALCKVTVKAKNIVATAIHLSASASTMAIGENLQLNAIVEPDNTSNKTVTWTSTNTSVATVDASGLVKALSEGNTMIVATTTDGSNLSAICEINVEKQFVAISDLQINPSNARIAIGTTIALRPIITPSEASSKEISWSSVNPTIATVDQEGLVTACTEGEAIIIASTQDGSNLSATCKIVVYKEIVPVSEIILTPDAIEGKEGETVSINTMVLPTNATNKQLVWYSSDENIAVVSDGVVSLLNKGKAVITAEASDASQIKAECVVNVFGSSDIGFIINGKDTYVEIYTLNGLLIFDGLYSDAKIAPGYYIVVSNGKSFKTRIE